MHIGIRILIGAVGGFSAIIVKYLTQDHVFVARWSTLNDPRLFDIILGYLILTPILVFLGAVIAGLSDETNKMKLLALGVSAPALITTWAGGVAAPSSSPNSHNIGPAGWNLKFSPISSAMAGEVGTQVAQATNIQKGIDAFFGGGKGEPRFWVVVSSVKNENEARSIADKINAQVPEMKAFVGKKAPDNDYFPVIVGDFLPLLEAKKLEARVLRLDGVDRTYLSSYPDRLP